MAAHLDPHDVCTRHGAAILRRCTAILRSRHDAEDATQEIFMVILAKGAAFRGDAELTTWLYRVATNHCLNRLRSAGRQARREEAEAVVDWSTAAPADPYAQYAAKATLRVLTDIFDELDQEIFVLKFLDGLTQDEIARVTERSRRTIATRLAHIEARVAKHAAVAS